MRFPHRQLEEIEVLVFASVKKGLMKVLIFPESTSKRDTYDLTLKISFLKVSLSC